MNEINKKKIGVLLSSCSTGGAKYLYLLLSSIVKLNPNYQITVWEDLKEPYAKNLIKDKLTPLGVTFKTFNSREFVEKKKCKIKIINTLINDFRRFKKSFDKLSPKILNEFDLIFCPWPYEFSCPETETPIVCVPHDLNYTHHFGGNIYEYSQVQTIKKQHEVWFKNSTPIVSTNFMAKELRKAFPNLKDEIGVVHLSKFNNYKKNNDNKADKILQDLGIDYDYILSANNHCYHKNYNILYSGYYYLKQKHPDIKLILVGMGTENFRGKSTSPNYIDIFNSAPDVIGLGLVSDETLMALIEKAKMVVNSSLYEAGNGSGLDAWSLGTPVAMSDIEPFKEQTEVLGVKAQFFDPQCGKSVGNAMMSILENQEQTQKDIELSREAINNYSWDIVAQKYLDFFEKIMER